MIYAVWMCFCVRAADLVASNPHLGIREVGRGRSITLALKILGLSGTTCSAPLTNGIERDRWFKPAIPSIISQKIQI
jgi:hypothetical protein